MQLKWNLFMGLTSYLRFWEIPMLRISINDVSKEASLNWWKILNRVKINWSRDFGGNSKSYCWNDGSKSTTRSFLSIARLPFCIRHSQQVFDRAGFDAVPKISNPTCIYYLKCSSFKRTHKNLGGHLWQIDHFKLTSNNNWDYLLFIAL